MSRDIWVVLGTIAAVFLFKKFRTGQPIVPTGIMALNAGATLHPPQAAPGNISGINAGTSFSPTTDQSRNPANSQSTWTRGFTPRRVRALQGTVNY